MFQLGNVIGIGKNSRHLRLRPNFQVQLQEPLIIATNPNRSPLSLTRDSRHLSRKPLRYPAPWTTTKEIKDGFLLFEVSFLDRTTSRRDYALELPIK